METEEPIFKGDKFIQRFPGGHGFHAIDGEINIFGYSEDFHNGPYCVFCEEGWCHHCVTDEYYFTETCSKAPIVVFETKKADQLEVADKAVHISDSEAQRALE